MADAETTKREVTGFEAFELASLRNSPLSVIRPDELGRVPMARGRFLMPVDGAVIVENLQIPGRDVPIRSDNVIEAYFQHDGEVFQFRSRVLEMDTPVRLNDAMVVKGMKIAAPVRIERGNRRSIYRQSFASVQPPVDAAVWAVPLSMLTPEQLEKRKIIRAEAAEPAADDGPDAMAGFKVERGERAAHGLSPAETVYEPLPGLSLEQLRPLMKLDPHWKGEVADASEFGLGLVLHRLVYSRLKVFQPLVARFTLPGTTTPLEFLLEVRRVQGVGDCNARVGGLLLINAANPNEVRAARDLAKFTLDLQRERARKMREAA